VGALQFFLVCARTLHCIDSLTELVITSRWSYNRIPIINHLEGGTLYVSILVVIRQDADDTMRGGENIIITKGIIQSCSRTISFTTNKFQLIL
jgi:hypothetical protein